MEGFAFPDMDKILYGNHGRNLMKTDVKEKDLSFYAKEQILWKTWNEYQPFLELYF